MKILIHSAYADSMGLAHHLSLEGHQVKIYIEEENMRGAGEGLVDKSESMLEGMMWKPDFVMFDFTKTGKLADEIRKTGVPVWGGSEFADNLERDRKFGADFMKKCGIKIPDTTEFKTVEEAINHIKSKPDVYVVKLDGDCPAMSSYVSESPQDMIEFLNFMKEQGLLGKETTFILQKKMDGMEVSTEVIFSQGNPIPPFNHTFETKKFMPGDLGPATGCETSVVFPILGKSKMIDQTLSKTFAEMKKIKYTGHLDINCIVDEKTKQAMALEWTPRLGYSSIYAMLAMCSGNIGEMLYKLAKGTIAQLPITSYWGTSLRMSIPPYPEEENPDIYEKSQNLWIKPPKDLKNTWFVSVKKEKNRLLTSGFYGLVAECTGQGKTLSEAWKVSQKTFDDLHVPQKMGRYIDGIESATKRIKTLKQWGFEMPEVN